MTAWRGSFVSILSVNMLTKFCFYVQTGELYYYVLIVVFVHRCNTVLHLVLLLFSFDCMSKHRLDYKIYGFVCFVLMDGNLSCLVDYVT